ncbi:hypothetical protein BDZ89DRAFT_533826 [Hymenopellis radicata]|nr:hypothetical protein BDZ89DRAFT_533826 [Hymenopellis radicata]
MPDEVTTTFITVFPSCLIHLIIRRRLRPFQNTSHSTPSYLNDIVSVRSHYSLWIGGRNLSWGLSVSPYPSAHDRTHVLRDTALPIFLTSVMVHRGHGAFSTLLAPRF